jgi:hypothetical protein
MDSRLPGVIAAIERYYGPRLLALALFGSRVGHRARADFDWDLLVVLAAEEPIRRMLYREWDEQLRAQIEPRLSGVSPHFVHLPSATDPPSSLWLEVSPTHAILHDPSGRLAAHVRTVRELIDPGRYERRFVHGLSYWRSAE